MRPALRGPANCESSPSRMGVVAYSVLILIRHRLLVLRGWLARCDRNRRCRAVQWRSREFCAIFCVAGLLWIRGSIRRRSDREGWRVVLVLVANQQRLYCADNHVCRLGAGTLCLRWRCHGGGRWRCCRLVASNSQWFEKVSSPISLDVVCPQWIIQRRDLITDFF
jgi:hypothetical protein